VYFLRLVLRNALRHRLRTMLTIVGIVVAITAFGLLRTIVDAWYAGANASSSARLITRSSVSLAFSMPLTYAQKIRQIPGVTAVSWASWFGGVYITERNFFPQFAVDPQSYLAIYPEFVLSPVEQKAFFTDRQGAIVGRKLAGNAHFGAEFRERGGQADHHVVKEDRLDFREMAGRLERRDLGHEAIEERHDHVVRRPFEPRIFGAAFLAHEAVKFREGDGVLENRSVLGAQPVEGRELGGALVEPVPCLSDLTESELGGRAPEDVLATKVIGNERVLEPRSMRDCADAGRSEPFLSELRQRSIKNRASRVDGPSLFGPLLRPGARTRAWNLFGRSLLLRFVHSFPYHA